MGLTLSFSDFKQVLRNPWTVGVGFLAQYIVKPALGYVIAGAMGLSPPLATGLVLVSCCPGGQASNVATYIAHGNVALSVLMTTCSTIAAIFMTPLLTKVLAGQLVPVDAVGLALSTFQASTAPRCAALRLLLLRGSAPLWPERGCVGERPPNCVRHSLPALSQRRLPPERDASCPSGFFLRPCSFLLSFNPTSPSPSPSQGGPRPHLPRRPPQRVR